MKKITLLLLTTILAMGIATLFTACPEPKPEAKPEPAKSGGGGGTSKSTPPSAVTTPTVTAGTTHTILMVQVMALAAGKFGTSASNGTTPLTAADITYTFYYAKKDETIGSKTAKTATADELYAALKALATNAADKGKVTLTTDAGIGTPKAVPKLTPGEEYHYTVRVQETAAPANGSNTNKAKTNTSSAAEATGKPPTPTFSGTAEDNTHTGFTTDNIEAAPMDTARKADGTPVNPDGIDVEYKLYYASGTDALTTPTQVKEAALTASKTEGDKTGGVKDAAVGSPISVTDRAFTGTVYAVLEAIIRTDTSKTALSDTASYKITGASTAPTSVKNPMVIPGAAAASATGFEATWEAANLTGAKKDNNAPLEPIDVTYILRYTSGATAPANAESVKADSENGGKTTAKTAGKVALDPGTTSLAATVSTRTFIGKVYVVVEAKSAGGSVLSGITEYTVSGLAQVPQKTDVNVVAGKGQLSVKVTALTAGFGKADDGTPLDDDTVRYIFYYAKKGQQFDVGITDTNVEEAGVTSDAMYAKLKDPGLTPDINGGRITLSTSGGVGTTAKVVSDLTLNIDYYYFARVEQTDDAANGVNSNKGGPVTTLTLAEKPGAVTRLRHTWVTDTSLKVTATPPDNLGKLESGDPVGADEIEYTLYYARLGRDPVMVSSGGPVSEVKRKAEYGSVRSQSVIGGVLKITGNTALTTTGFTLTIVRYHDKTAGITNPPHYYFIRSEHPEDAALFADSGKKSSGR